MDAVRPAGLERGPSGVTAAATSDPFPNFPFGICAKKYLNPGKAEMRGDRPAAGLCASEPPREIRNPTLSHPGPERAIGRQPGVRRLRFPIQFRVQAGLQLRAGRERFALPQQDCQGMEDPWPRMALQCLPGPAARAPAVGT